VFGITRDADRVNALHWRLEGHQTLAVSIASVKRVEGPNGDLVVPALLLQASAHSECIVLIVRAANHEELVNVVGVSFVEESLLLKRWVETKKQVGLTE
jgi:hypothetical protein